MTEEESSHKTHQQEIKWLVEILENHPQAMYEKQPNNTWESSRVMPILYPGKRFAATDDDFTSELKTVIKNIGTENFLNLPTSILINANHNTPKEQGLSSMEQAKNFLSEKGIGSHIIPPVKISNVHALIIDLAQDNLLPKLRKIYNEEVIPELVKNGRTEIIDPDGRDVTPEDIAAKRIDAQIITLLENAAAANIQPRELQEMFTRNKKKFEAQGNSR